MQGKIEAKNYEKKLYAVETAENEYIVFELLDSVKFEIGNLIFGSLDELGPVVLKNKTLLVNFSAIIKKTKSNKIDAFQMIESVL